MDTREYYPENNRIKVLNSLVEFLEPLDLLSDKLKKLSWDYTGLPVILKTEHLTKILRNCISGKLTVKEVEDWANLIECREDIDYEEINKEKLMATIFKLANPELEGKLSIGVCSILLSNLEKK